MRLKIAIIFLVGTLVQTGSALAGLTILTNPSASVYTLTAGGGTVYIPVYVKSDAVDSLGQFTIGFDITPAASPHPNASGPVASPSFVAPAS